MGCFRLAGAGQRRSACDKSHRSSPGPCAVWAHDGLPRSIMFTGRLYDEGPPLTVALAYERSSKWHAMRPKMDWA